MTTKAQKNSKEPKAEKTQANEVQQKEEIKSAEAPKKRPRGKKLKQVPQGRVYIKSSFNNTIISVTDQKGNVLVQGSAGSAGFRGSKKSTPFAASVAMETVMKKAKVTYGLNEVDVFVRGVGSGRESAVRALGNAGVIVNSIRDITPIPHNGCRAKKPRRV